MMGQKSSYVVFVSEQPFEITEEEHIFFTIVSADQPEERLKAMQAGNPRGLTIINTVRATAKHVINNVNGMHRAWQTWAIGPSREWFRAPRDLVYMFIAHALEVLIADPAATRFSVHRRTLRDDPAPQSVTSQPFEASHRLSGPNGNGKLRVHRNGDLTCDSSPVPNSPPPRELITAAAGNPELREILTPEALSALQEAAKPITIYDLF